MYISSWHPPELRKSILAAHKLIPENQLGTPAILAHDATLRKASLWWATAEMTALATHTADTLPPWTPMIARPEPEGLMMWAAEIGTTGDEEKPGYHDHGPATSALATGQVHAVHWSIIDSKLTLTLYGPVISEIEQARSKPVWKSFYELGIFIVPADVEFDPRTTQLLDRDMANILHVVGASWLLMQQPTVAKQRRQRPRPSNGQRREKTIKKKDLIQVIELRRIASPPSEKDDSERSSREYHFRWPVRGFWRNQRVGPGRKYSKPVYVAPHIRGPEGKPLKTESVNAWRR